jgi:hypothetical protein
MKRIIVRGSAGVSPATDFKNHPGPLVLKGESLTRTLA